MFSFTLFCTHLWFKLFSHRCYWILTTGSYFNYSSASPHCIFTYGLRPQLCIVKSTLHWCSIIWDLLQHWFKWRLHWPWQAADEKLSKLKEKYKDLQLSDEQAMSITHEQFVQRSIVISLFGAHNSGKSTLLNALLGGKWVIYILVTFLYLSLAVSNMRVIELGSV